MSAFRGKLLVWSLVPTVCMASRYGWIVVVLGRKEDGLVWDFESEIAHGFRKLI